MRTLRVEAAKWSADADGEWLCLKSSHAAIMDTLQALDSGKKYIAEIKQERKARSLNANAYYWRLCGELSYVLRIPPDEIYRQHIRDVGGNYEVIRLPSRAVQSFTRSWCAGHVGRVIEDMGTDRNNPDFCYLRVFYGSSDYDTRQMSRLIELMVADCKEHHIETLTPEEMGRMMLEWEDKGAANSAEGKAAGT